MTFPLIVSFYTDNWQYPQYAHDLSVDCQRLGLEYNIQRKEDTGDYIKNTSLKANFIRDCLLQFQRPLLWIDVDGSLLQKPEFCRDLDPTAIDMAARRHQTIKDRAWHVGTLWFNYNARVLEFVNTWCQHAITGTDEHAFDQAWQSHHQALTASELPETYFIVETRHMIDPPPDTVILHRLSKSPDKMRRKYPNGPQWEPR